MSALSIFAIFGLATISAGNAFPHTHLDASSFSGKSMTSSYVRRPGFTMPLIRSLQGSSSLKKHSILQPHPEPTISDVIAMLKNSTKKQDEMSTAIDVIAKDLENVKNVTKKMSTAIDVIATDLENVEKMSTAIDVIATDLENVKETLSHVAREQGRTNERLLRVEIAKMFGEDFARQYTVNGLQSLVQLVYSASGFQKQKAEPSEIARVAAKLARNLVNDRVGWRMLSTYFKKLQTLEGLDKGDPFDMLLYGFKEKVNKEYSNDENIDEEIKILNSVRKSISVLKQYPDNVKNKVTTLVEKLRRLCEYLTMNDDGKMKNLVECRSAGIMLLQWDAYPGYADAGTIWMVIPPIEIDMDIKGSVDVVGNSAFIQVGEIKTNFSTSKTKALWQIELRANVLKWAVMNLDQQLKDIVLAGHIFVGTSEDIPDEDSYMSSDISIFVHSV